MQPSEFVTIRPHLERAIQDIDTFLDGLQERENVERELCELYDRMVAGETPPKVKGRGKPLHLTKKQETVLAETLEPGFHLLSDEQAAVLAELPGEPMSDAEWNALQFELRGGWQTSSRQAAVWLRNAGRITEANGIDVELSRLPGEPRGAAEARDNRNARQFAAGRVKAILTACLSATSNGLPATGEEVSGENGEKSPRRRTRKGKRKVDPKIAAKRDERAKQTKIDKEIFSDWHKTEREDYQDYVDWKNEYLPEGWPALTRRYVALAIQREKSRLKRAGKWPRK